MRKGSKASPEVRRALLVSAFDRSTVPKATRNPTTAELYWIAGFLEGEGNFRGQGNTPKTKTTWTESVRAVQVNKEPVLLLQVLLGGTLVHKSRGGGPRQDVWSWIATGARGRGIMMTLYPLMSERRQQQIFHALHPDAAATAA